METISVTTHFNGEQIKLDEPLGLEPNTKLIVTVLPSQDDEHSSWQHLSVRGLANAYAEDEEEYTLADVKVANPAYERG